MNSLRKNMERKINHIILGKIQEIQLGKIFRNIVLFAVKVNCFRIDFKQILLPGGI
ncbi:MAG: hypothetical protein K0S41_581 [Anaerocolumna sp.]|jgi:hypothetical protein|nr:hypothetical protein [Anaerocolumna sp.]